MVNGFSGNFITFDVKKRLCKKQKLEKKVSKESGVPIRNSN